VPLGFVPNASAVLAVDPNGLGGLLTGPLRLWPDTTAFRFYWRCSVTGLPVTEQRRVLAVSGVRRRR
jgi:hypothetical protein